MRPSRARRPCRPYAAFAFRAWLTGSSVISDRTRRFACWSAIASLLLGMSGLVTYHLLAQPERPAHHGK